MSFLHEPVEEATSVSTDRELWCPSIDVCAICSDVYCDGVGCIQDLNPDDPDDAPMVEQRQTWVRLGRIQEQANAFLAEVENRIVRPASVSAKKAEHLALIGALHSALAHLNDWCPSAAPRQAEIDRLLSAPPLPMQSLLQLRARFGVSSSTAAVMDQTVVDE